MKETRLPNFDLSEYRWLLNELQEGDYSLVTVCQIEAQDPSRCVYLRHDVDFFTSAAMEMATQEAEIGACATYYFLVSGPYNPLNGEDRRTIRAIAEMGHEIGLHYDLELYSQDPDCAMQDLSAEIGILERVCGTTIKTIAPHCPYRDNSDPFREHSSWTNPYDPRFQRDLVYVSDSCRAWRDETLLRCFSPNPPVRLMLLTHPELWLDGDVRDRMTYLDKVVTPHATRSLNHYYSKTVRDIWRTHAGAKAHDKREAVDSP